MYVHLVDEAGARVVSRSTQVKEEAGVVPCEGDSVCQCVECRVGQWAAPEAGGRRPGWHPGDEDPLPSRG